MTKLYSGFPGTGKTYYFEHSDKAVMDSDSSTFDKSHFPQNYIEHIKKHLDTVDTILISSHKEVREALIENGLRFTLVYPHRNRKAEYLNRYKVRGSDKAFIELLDKNWDEWLLQLGEQQGCGHTVLGPNEFLSDVIE